MQIIPLELMQRTDKKYPKAFKRLNWTYKDKSQTWHKEYCYCPIGLGINYIQKFKTKAQENNNFNFFHTEGLNLAVIASWKQAKSIYHINESLTEEFLQNKEDILIAPETLTLPEYCIYIDTGEVFLPMQGFFVMFDDNGTKNPKKLYVIPVKGNNFCGSSFITIPDKPTRLSLLVQQTWNIGKPLKEENKIDFRLKESWCKTTQNIFRYAINILMYLSAVNAEIRFTNEKSLRTHGKAKDTVKGIKQYQIGEKLGIRLKNFHKNTVIYKRKNNASTHHKSPVMHIRRAHNHTYRIGKGKKEKIIKWIPPIVINANGDEIDYITITDIKNEKTDKEKKHENS